eukprot:11573385-Karenia_brevis.AAC.1
MPIRVLMNASKISGVELHSLPQYVLGCEDMEDAYRSVPNSVHSLPYCIYALYHTQKRSVQFVISYALLFGQASAVNNFNRLPAFMASLACRVLAVPVWNYFDDFA